VVMTHEVINMLNQDESSHPFYTNSTQNTQTF
jgi:hypothetical protein